MPVVQKDNYRSRWVTVTDNHAMPFIVGLFSQQTVSFLSD